MKCSFCAKSEPRWRIHQVGTSELNVWACDDHMREFAEDLVAELSAGKEIKVRPRTHDADDSGFAKPARPAVGDILVQTWGYERTDVDFYQVVRATDASVWLREIQSRVVEERRDQLMVVPVHDQFVNRNYWDNNPAGTRYPIRKGGGNAPYSVRIRFLGSSRSSASPWDGRPVYVSPWDMGH